MGGSPWLRFYAQPHIARHGILERAPVEEMSLERVPQVSLLRPVFPESFAETEASGADNVLALPRLKA